ncbi:hypothetical protein M3Y97_00612700 [Aphelenchoides bicaudatus]|nr:hypothetical protein M3Y97_00612700 [Aphelenchoides bicaudatus]
MLPALTAVEEFVQQINQIASNQQTSQQFLISNAHLNTTEFDDAQAILIVQLQKALKESLKEAEFLFKSSTEFQQKLDSTAATRQDTAYPIELQTQPPTISIDATFKDKESAVAGLSSTAPTTVEVKVDTQLSLDEQKVASTTVEKEITVDSAIEAVQPAGNEVTSYSFEAKVQPLNEQSTQIVSQPQSAIQSLSLQAEQKEVVNVDEKLNAKTVDEFAEQIEKLSTNESATQTFVISTAHLEAAIRSLRDQSQEEVKVWAASLRGRLVKYVYEFDNVQCILVVDLHRIIKEVRDETSKLVSDSDALQQSLQTRAQSPQEKLSKEVAVSSTNKAADTLSPTQVPQAPQAFKKPEEVSGAETMWKSGTQPVKFEVQMSAVEPTVPLKISLEADVTANLQFRRLIKIPNAEFTVEEMEKTLNSVRKVEEWLNTKATVQEFVADDFEFGAEDSSDRASGQRRARNIETDSVQLTISAATSEDGSVKKMPIDEETKQKRREYWLQNQDSLPPLPPSAEKPPESGVDLKKPDEVDSTSKTVPVEAKAYQSESATFAAVLPRTDTFINLCMTQLEPSDQTNLYTIEENKVVQTVPQEMFTSLSSTTDLSLGHSQPPRSVDHKSEQIAERCESEGSVATTAEQHPAKSHTATQDYSTSTDEHVLERRRHSDSGFRESVASFSHQQQVLANKYARVSETPTEISQSLSESVQMDSRIDSGVPSSPPWRRIIDEKLDDESRSETEIRQVPIEEEKESVAELQSSKHDFIHPFTELSQKRFEFKTDEKSESISSIQQAANEENLTKRTKQPTLEQTALTQVSERQTADEFLNIDIKEKSKTGDQLNTKASTDESLQMSTEIRRADSVDRADFQNSTTITTSLDTRFDQNTTVADRKEFIQPIERIEKTNESLNEYGKEEITSTVNLQKLKTDDSKSFDKQLPVPKTFEQHLTTPASKTENANRQFDLQKLKDSDNKTEVIKRISRSQSTEIRSKAAGQEVTNFQTSLTATGDREKAHFLARSKSQDAVHRKLPEFLHAETNLYYSKSFINDEAAAETLFGDMSAQHTLINARSSALASADFSTQINKMSKDEATQYLQKLSESENEARQFKISTTNRDINFDKKETPHEMKETIQKLSRTESTGTQAHEFTNNEITSTVDLKRVKGDEIKSFDKQLPVPKTFEQHLTTPASKNEVTDRQFDLQKLKDSDNKTEITKKISRSQSTEIRSKAAGQEVTNFQTSLTATGDREQAHFFG